MWDEDRVQNVRQGSSGVGTTACGSFKRDALLPKVISGEVRVKDAERLLVVEP